MRKTSVQQLTCNIDLPCSFSSVLFSLSYNPLFSREKSWGENSGKNVKNSETILPFSCCPSVLLWERVVRVGTSRANFTAKSHFQMSPLRCPDETPSPTKWRKIREVQCILFRERSNSGSHWSGFAISGLYVILTFYTACPFLGIVPWNWGGQFQGKWPDFIGPEKCRSVTPRSVTWPLPTFEAANPGKSEHIILRIPNG